VDVTTLESLPIPLGQHGFEECGGILYAVCGGSEGVEMNRLYAYDPTTGHWTRKADAPISGQSPVWKAVGGKLYLIGGYRSDLGVKSDETYEYDPSQDSWTQKADMPHAREDMGGAVVGGKIYIFGGLTNPGHTFASYIDVYNPGTDSWESRSWFSPVALGDFAAPYGDKIVLVSGTGDMGGYPNDLRATRQVLLYDPALNSFSSLADCPVAACYKEIDVVGDKLYMIGGAVDGAYDFTGDVQVLDLVQNTWSVASNVISPNGEMASCVFDGAIYFCGGWLSPGHNDDAFRRLSLAEYVDMSTASGLVLSGTATLTVWSRYGRIIRVADGQERSAADAEEGDLVYQTDTKRFYSRYEE